MQALKFSIIVPVYQVEEYLDRCVESLIGQTYKNIEIILVDDGSKDNSGKMCDLWAEKDSRIIVCHKSNGGLSDARNYGFDKADGDYILYVDSDDYIEADTCEKLSVFAEKGYDIVIGDAIVEGGKAYLDHISSNEVMTGEEYLLSAYLEGKAPMAAWLNLYRKNFLVENGLRFKCGILHEDEEFTPRAMLAAKSVVVTGVCFYHYVLRENSITTKKDKSRNAGDLYDTCCELERLYNVLEDGELKEQLLNSLSDKYLNMFFVGRLYKHGRNYIHKDFIKRNARLPRTKKKAKLYCLSPRLYYYTNKILKSMSK